MKKKRFHQMVLFEKGPVHTVVYDALKGNIYQVENSVMKKYEDNLEDEDVTTMLEFFEGEEMICIAEESDWFPGLDLKIEEDDKPGIGFILEIEEGVPIDIINDRFKRFDLIALHYYGGQVPETLQIPAKIEIFPKDMSRCYQHSQVTGDFTRIKFRFYQLNRQYNSCWYRKIAVTYDLKIRPCIFSKIEIGNLLTDNLDDVIQKAQEYWKINKDKIYTCKECELKYFCFDCREIALQVSGNLFASNPYCSYNPHTGEWIKN